MLIATWNVNSIRSRLTQVTDWLGQLEPDVLCLQETKVLDEAFPFEPFQRLGYECVVHGQKSYNGVAILSRQRAEDVAPGFDDGGEEVGTRLLGVTLAGVRIYSVYVPNGQVVGSPAWDVKLEWLARLKGMLQRHYTPEDKIVLCGDYNIAPEDRDVYSPEFWRTQVLFHPQARASLADLCEFGLVDAFRLHHDEGGLYSWWDYRAGAFTRNLGLRIDHILASRGLAKFCSAASIDRATRAGTGTSDHAPVLARFDL